jgi:hypothetical protein
MAAGVFGYGSEVLRLDDEYSTDHHFGLRVNVLLPEGVMAARGAAIEDALAEGLPPSGAGANCARAIRGRRAWRWGRWSITCARPSGWTARPRPLPNGWRSPKKT